MAKRRQRTEPKLTVTITARSGHLDRFLMSKKVNPDALTDEQYELAVERALKAKRCTKAPAIPKVKTSKEDWERKAIQYARWLAERDGIDLPDNPKYNWPAKPRVEWSGVNVRTSTGKWRFEKRIRAVTWGRSRDVFNTRANGKRGAYLGKAWETELEIVLPNWDWIPDVIDLSDMREAA